jgi:hypothetical protein
LLVAYEFSVGDVAISLPRWGTYFRNNDKAEHAFWLTLRELPLVEPWSAPETWAEFRAIARQQKVDLDGHLRWMYHHLHERHSISETYLLIGFPIPAVYDGIPVRMHWQPMLLPPPIVPSSNSFGVRKGKKISAIAWPLERARLLSDEMAIGWLESEPWAEDRLCVRGALSKELREARVVLIGGGSLGSALADFLVRGGVNDILICDDESLELGNLRRHILNITDAEYLKSFALALHLNTCSPFARVRFACGFPNNLRNELEAVQHAQIVIDCTASDDVITRLGGFGWSDADRWFFSGSLGVDARRLFFYTHHGRRFPSAKFFESVHPYVEEERALLHERDPKSMYGAGCWNPVFPARWHDVMTLAARMLRAVDATVACSSSESRLAVLDLPA